MIAKLFSNVEKRAIFHDAAEKEMGEGRREDRLFFWDEHDSITKGCTAGYICSSRLSVFVSKRSRQTCLSHFAVASCLDHLSRKCAGFIAI